MAEVARQTTGESVDHEISIENVDKPPLDYHEIESRASQVHSGRVVWLTRASTFVEKSRLFPEATFVVGADTLCRIADPRYYAGSPSACEAALNEIASHGCRFLVFGRDSGAGFTALPRVDMSDSLRAVCQEVPEEKFRQDISSTEIRRVTNAEDE